MVREERFKRNPEWVLPPSFLFIIHPARPPLFLLPHFVLLVRSLAQPHCRYIHMARCSKTLSLYVH